MLISTRVSCWLQGLNELKRFFTQSHSATVRITLIDLSINADRFTNAPALTMWNVHFSWWFKCRMFAGCLIQTVYWHLNHWNQTWLFVCLFRSALATVLTVTVTVAVLPVVPIHIINNTSITENTTSIHSYHTTTLHQAITDDSSI